MVFKEKDIMVCKKDVFISGEKIFSVAEEYIINKMVNNFDRFIFYYVRYSGIECYIFQDKNSVSYLDIKEHFHTPDKTREFRINKLIK